MSKLITFAVVTFLANTMLGAFVPVAFCAVAGLVGVVLFSAVVK